MDAVMCLTTVATRLGDRCGLVVFDRAVRTVLPPRAGREQAAASAEAMYALDPVLAESDYRGAFTQTMARFKRRSLIVLFTDLVEQAVGESLLPSLPLLVRHHLVVVAAVPRPGRDGLGQELARRRRRGLPGGGGHQLPGRPGSSCRSAARMGAMVVDAPAGELPPRLADVYLDLKARGSL